MVVVGILLAASLGAVVACGIAHAVGLFDRGLP